MTEWSVGWNLRGCSCIRSDLAFQHSHWGTERTTWKLMQIFRTDTFKLRTITTELKCLLCRIVFAGGRKGFHIKFQCYFLLCSLIQRVYLTQGI